MFTVITPLVKAKLDTLKGTGKPLAQVLDYHTEKATGFPFACFESVGFTAEILDTCSNLRTYSYLSLIHI